MSKKPEKPDIGTPKSAERQITRRSLLDIFKEGMSEKSADDNKPKKVKISRRDIFLLFAGGGIGCVAAKHEMVISVLNAAFSRISGHVKDLLRPDEYGEELVKNIKYLEERYSCEIKFEHQGLPSLDEKRKKLTKIRIALSKYPPDFIKKLELKFIFSSLRSDLAGSAESETGYIDLAKDNKFEETPTIYHEIHHIAAGKVGCKLLCDWAFLNPDGKKAYVDKEWKKFEDHPKKGFSDAYGMLSEGEDQAEIARILFANPKFLYEMAKKDAVIAKKMERLKEFYGEVSDGKMDLQYWIDLGNIFTDVKINEEYWDARK